MHLGLLCPSTLSCVVGGGWCGKSVTTGRILVFQCPPPLTLKCSPTDDDDDSSSSSSTLPDLCPRRLVITLLGCAPSLSSPPFGTPHSSQSGPPPLLLLCSDCLIFPSAGCWLLPAAAAVFCWLLHHLKSSILWLGLGLEVPVGARIRVGAATRDRCDHDLWWLHRAAGWPPIASAVCAWAYIRSLPSHSTMMRLAGFCPASRFPRTHARVGNSTASPRPHRGPQLLWAVIANKGPQTTSC